MAGPGLTFSPTVDGADQRTASAALSPQQRAVQVLSMRLPRILGARSIAPRDLMGAAGAVPSMPGGGFSPESALLQTLINSRGVGERTIDPSMFSGAAGALSGSAPFAPGTPAPPVITPGIRDPSPDALPGIEKNPLPPPLPPAPPTPPQRPEIPRPGPSGDPNGPKYSDEGREPRDPRLAAPAPPAQPPDGGVSDVLSSMGGGDIAASQTVARALNEALQAMGIDMRRGGVAH